MKIFVLALTISRITLSPLIFIFSIFFEYYWTSFFLFNLIALTDFLDGRLARDFNVESRLGAILDPIADKVLLVFVIISIIILSDNNFISFVAAFMLARELWVSGLRELASSEDKSVATKVSFTAKSKTAIQFIALSMYLFAQATGIALMNFIASFFLFLALLLSYKSAITYTLNVFSQK